MSDTSLQDATTKLASLGPVAQSVPSVGPELGPIVDLVSQRCEEANKVKRNKKDAVALVNRAVQTTTSIVNGLKDKPEAEVANHTDDVRQLKALVDELEPTIKHLAEGSYRPSFSYKNSSKKKDVDDLIRRFDELAKKYGVQSDPTAPNTNGEQLKDGRGAKKENAECSKLLQEICAIIENKQPTSLPSDVSPEALKKVLVYCNYYKDKKPLYDPNDPPGDSTHKRSVDISEWDQSFLTVDKETFFEILIVAESIKIKPLYEIGYQTLANMIKGKTPEQIRRLFDIENDFNPNEEAEFKKENEWVAQNPQPTNTS